MCRPIRNGDSKYLQYTNVVDHTSKHGLSVAYSVARPGRSLMSMNVFFLILSAWIFFLSCILSTWYHMSGVCRLYVPDPVAVLGHISVYRLRVCLYSVFITLGIIVVSFRRSRGRSPEYYTTVVCRSSRGSFFFVHTYLAVSGDIWLCACFVMSHWMSQDRKMTDQTAYSWKQAGSKLWNIYTPTRFTRHGRAKVSSCFRKGGAFETI